jgi:hypothetical protein
MTTIDQELLDRVREAQALLNANKQALKDHETQRKADLGVLGVEFLTHVVDEGDFKESDSSDWAGFSESAVPVTINGKAYTVSLTITDVKAKEARTTARKAKEEAAAKAPVTA